MNPKVPIRKLVAEVLAELERLNYAKNTCNQYRRFYNRLITFADSIGETMYSEDLGNKYLRMHHNFDLENYTTFSHRTFRGQARCIRVLGDYQLHGAIMRRKTTKVPYERTPQFAEALEGYQKECVQRNYSEQGMRTRIYRVRLFIDYLDDCGLASLSLLTAQHLSDYTRTIAGYHKKSISAILTTLRSFLKFLYLKGYHEKDLSDDVPKLKQPHCPKIPSAWKPEDVKRVLEAVDRGNPNGKRDYAILLMVARLGMRVQDIKELKLTNLNWAARNIEIVQHKTKRTVNYPILDDIGWAIIDYLKNGRPQTKSPHLFVRHHAPFETFGPHANLHNIIAKYTRLAGIKLRTGAAQGMHSLRHTLASVLLEQETPLPVISEILGHMNTMSTSVYLKIDLEGLRKCALDPDEVFQYDDI
ncbi:site-specific integrase [Desulfoscipio geothermicus]|uniref:Site-specific recombinase XerD n=1 Tax=Desulfoscipio geothermicus DSM 3669 TaxID=1121426 RepID=A0A1I6ELG7_9FIRM|nr:site-specific integrase [Desulfoscipio geothermicus]SFR18614.1 Site-specific recombinase XerD [Desulfoscipio geothermicus DSM 3669]